MNLMPLYYFKEVAKDLNMTKTASRLFISQQALSKCIAQLEKDYNVVFFIRKPHLRLTSAGEAMLAFCRKVLHEQQNLQEILSDITEDTKGTIRFGASMLRSNFCLPQILPQFSHHYPHVNIRVSDHISETLQNMILQDELDVALCSLNEPISEVETHLILSDNVYLCVTDKLLQQYYPSTYPALKEKSRLGAFIGDFSRLPFLTLDSPNKLGRVMDHCFKEAGFVPKSYLSATFTRLFPALCSHSLAACVCTQMTLNTYEGVLPRDMNIFHLRYRGKYVYHNVYLTHAKKTYVPQYMNYFYTLINDCFASLNRKDLSRISP